MTEEQIRHQFKSILEESLKPYIGKARVTDQLVVFVNNEIESLRLRFIENGSYLPDDLKLLKARVNPHDQTALILSTKDS